MDRWVQILLSKQEVLSAIERALDQNFIDNLRKRHPNVQIDSKIRGYVGEIAFKKWMKKNGIHFNSCNRLDESGTMDIDFIFKSEGKTTELELKTSLLPDADQYLENFVQKRDIKLIRRGNEPIEKLHADIHVQFAFNQLRLRKDQWLKEREINLKSDPLVIYDQIAAHRYCRDTYFIGWIDKNSLVQQIQSKAKHLQKWKYGKREFWTCNLQSESKKPQELVSYLKELTKDKTE